MATNFPGNAEACDGLDNDCSGTADFAGELTDVDTDNTITCADCNDADPLLNNEDADVDGFDTCNSTATGADCNDLHAAVFPGASIPDSPGSTNLIGACLDPDGDGYCIGGGEDLGGTAGCVDVGENYSSRFAAAAAAWGDCDETIDPAADIYLAESIVDGVDDDSDGLIDELCFAGTSGGVVITEIFSEATLGADADEYDWLEVYNATWHDVYLDGWTVDDATPTDTFTVGASVTMAPGAYGILADSAAGTTGVPSTLYVYGAASYSIEDINTADQHDLEITHSDSASTTATFQVDSVSAATTLAMTAPASASMSKELKTGQISSTTLPTTAAGPHIDNNAAGNWCDSTDTTTWSGQTASPASANSCN